VGTLPTPATHSDIDRTVERIVSRFAPRKVILFGSHAYGEPSADSDVDLLVTMNTAPTALTPDPSPNPGRGEPDRHGAAKISRRATNTDRSDWYHRFIEAPLSQHWERGWG
jgi:predicted nucleotidyltransferase